MKITRKAKIEAPASLVWNVLYAHFDRAHVWMSSVENSSAFEDAEGEGRVCQLTKSAKGLTSIEILNQVDTKKKILSFSATPTNTPILFPIQGSEITIAVEPLYNNTSCRVTYVSELDLNLGGNLIATALRFRTQANIDQTLLDLKTFVEERMAA